MFWKGGMGVVLLIGGNAHGCVGSLGRETG